MQNAAINAITLAFRDEWPRLVATLVRELRDLEMAEDVVQEAFVEASTRWRKDGVPDRPGGWLLTTARRKAIDRIRRNKRFDDRLPALAEAAKVEPQPEMLIDDQMALLFGCCHPALGIDAQVALTLRSVGGLSTAQIAHAFFVPEPTMAKRLVRAKSKIRAAGIPFTIPPRDRLADRLEAVCGVIYAVFTEGHVSSHGRTLLRGDLCDEAVWLAETLAELTPDDPEVRGLAALCLLTDSRRNARVDGNGQPVLLADQDRQRWDRDKIDRGLAHLISAPARPSRNSNDRNGPYRQQAMIAAVHSSAATFAATDWAAIVSIYDQMISAGGNPVVELNRAAAIAERDGAAAGLDLLEELDARGDLDHYLYLHSAKAELHRRLGNRRAAASAYENALVVCDNDAERTWLLGRLATVST